MTKPIAQPISTQSPRGDIWLSWLTPETFVKTGHRFSAQKIKSSSTFPICGNIDDAHGRHGSIHAKATWSISAEKAREDKLSRFRADAWHFCFVSSSHANGPIKCYAHN